MAIPPVDVRARTRKTGAYRAFRLTDGSPTVGWHPAGPRHRLAAWCVDIGLFILTFGVGWSVLTWHSWARGSTPGKTLLGITAFGNDTGRPATRSRMALRAVVYQGIAVLIGIATLGVGWLYCVASALGSEHRTLYDEWSQVVLLRRP